MTFGEIIERAQRRCREELLRAIQMRGSRGEKVIAEPAPRNGAGEIVSAPDGLGLPLRFDVAYCEPGGSFQTENAESVTIAFSEPVFATWESVLKIEIQSLAWDYLQIRCPVERMPADCEPLRAWFLKWFDLVDERTPDADGLLGVIHFLSDPSLEGGNFCFFADFGSASSDSLAELFDVLISMGMDQCILGEQPS